ncbi:MAG: ABC transporter substrate-binding protein [Candidatus Wallbacteria bacterium]|nr:ABC transporter substrate-binding protein [Candidatus Wallbacteria bacterium]
MAVAMVVAGLLAGGCGGGGVEPERGRVQPVVFWHSMAGDLGKTMRVIIEKFNALHPQTPVEAVYQGGYDLLAQKIRTSVVAGQPPVMAQMYEAWTAYLNRDRGQEAILDLRPMLAEPGFDREDVYPVLMEDVTFDGQVLAMPFNKSFPVLYYNRDLFLAAGLDPDRPPATWTEFAEYGRKLTRDTNGDGHNDIWGWSFAVDPWLYLCMVLQNGGTFLSEDGRSANFDRPPAVEALEYWIDACSGPRPFALRSTEFEPQNEYVAGKVAMVLTSSVSKAFMKPMIRFDMGMAPIPQGARHASIVAGTNVGIFRKASPEQQRAAWEFIQFFSATENTTFWAIKTNYIPVRRSATKSKVWTEWLKLDPTAGVAIRQMESATFEPRFPEWVDCRKVLSQAMTQALQERGNARERLAAANKEINAKLARRHAAR